MSIAAATVLARSLQLSVRHTGRGNDSWCSCRLTMIARAMASPTVVRKQKTAPPIPETQAQVASRDLFFFDASINTNSWSSSSIALEREDSVLREGESREQFEWEEFDGMTLPTERHTHNCACATCKFVRVHMPA